MEIASLEKPVKAAGVDVMTAVFGNHVILENILSNFIYEPLLGDKSGALLSDLLTCRKVSRIFNEAAKSALNNIHLFDLAKSGSWAINGFHPKKVVLRVLARERSAMEFLENGNLSNIKELRVNFLYADSNYYTTLGRILFKMPQLEVLELGFLQWMAYDQDLGKKEDFLDKPPLPKLRKVSVYVDYGSRLIPGKIWDLLPLVPVLVVELLNCDNVFAQGFLPDLRKKWPELENLKLIWVTYPGDKTIDLKALFGMKKLKKLHVGLSKVAHSEENGLNSLFQELREGMGGDEIVRLRMN